MEETLNGILEQVAEKLIDLRRLPTTSGDSPSPSGNVRLHVPRLKGTSIGTAIIEHYKPRESSVE